MSVCTHAQYKIKSEIMTGLNHGVKKDKIDIPVTKSQSAHFDQSSSLNKTDKINVVTRMNIDSLQIPRSNKKIKISRRAYTLTHSKLKS